MGGFWNYLTANYQQIFDLLGEHLYLSIVSVLIAIIIGVPLGILISNEPKLSKPIIGTTNVIQAVPSLALLGFLIPFIGIGSAPAIVMVVLYSLLPIVKNTYTGLTNIDGDILEAAKGIGLTKSQTMRKVQLPLAFPMIMAGIRISAVTAVGLMTIAAFVGAGGLGYLVFSGVQTVDNHMILAGAIPACILALLIDFAVGKLETSLSYTSKQKTASKSGKKTKRWMIALASLIIVIAGGFKVYSIASAEDKVIIGSKNFSESMILGNMLADLIENKTDLQVERKLNLGGTQVAFSAVNSGDIDLYVEYTGTGLVNILKQPPESDPDKVYTYVQKEFKQKYGLEMLKPIGFNNTYALAVRQDTAKEYGLETISDLAKVSGNLIMGPTIEFPNREDGLIGLSKTYNLEFKDVKAVDGGLRYTALDNHKSDVIDAFSTDGLLEAFHLKVLKDDQNFFPPYYAVPLIKVETLKEHPELKKAINSLAGKLTDEKMRQLNYKVDSLKQSPAKVAKDFLEKEGLLD
ncbi:substrate-binding region of ABC-type glycine betaine transport system [Neobacillus bataviensis LMG 21833]|uniref:Substrate-binding region of ABC-type glycine betaine transport system n=1 Tax=Neobacillus bataviensis LMG 21833 TaxID=1117379 RepID=K6C3N9_9BACI|nr:glycine betaine ABC transporter substrate-binding protein [Neobacillus bataviensis]EKN65760.1 substrate-binding region of ABC-type glycine betaine transport system [Neobacillus bataviensis LMG 21833]